ncbi:MAG: hypothetical protein CMC82_05975 [Flavobacteriaceae bacterium]|nr:hypothetical protein [Flavobacteriaceae bacterium]
MVSQEILKKKGCTPEKLREIFTCKEGGEHWETRLHFQDLVQSRILEGIRSCSKNAKLYMSVDLAWDSQPINKSTIPLLQYAKDQISIDDCYDKLQDLQTADQFCEYSDEGELKKINTLKLYEVSVNIIRSYVTRRVAAQASRFSNLYPYFKFEPRSTQISDKLRADVLSQRVEMMVDQFGYRHQFEQIIRQMFMYGHSVAFPVTSWTDDVQWRMSKDEMTGEESMESYSEKSGVEFKTPHPTRVIHDTSKPLHDINVNAADWIGYWEIVRYGDIKDNPSAFNTNEISVTNSLSNLYQQHSDFFGYYFNDDIVFPRVSDTFSMRNDRVAQTGLYASEDEDKGMFLTQMCMKVNPKRDRLGDYPHDVWLKLSVASDQTVVQAEYLPSLPAIYGGINENDDRVANISVAHEIMPYQDQLTNILTSMLEQMKMSMFKIFAIDQDALDDDVKEYIKSAIAEDTFYSKPKALFYSGQKAADLGINSSDFIKVVDVQKELSAGVSQSIQAILQLLNLVERLLILSPQELGQPAPREISATEVAEISNTTNAIYSFISEGIDDMRAAMKKVLYEHLVTCSRDKFIVPIKGRYSENIIREAGFEVETSGDEQITKRNVIGTPSSLIYEYLFGSRDGAERARDTQSAQVLGQLLMQILQVPDMPQALGRERIFEMFNEIFRMSGAHDLKLETDEMDQRQELENVGNDQFVNTLKEQWPEVLKAVQALVSAKAQEEELQEGEVAPGVQAPMQPNPEQQPMRSPEQQVQL